MFTKQALELLEKRYYLRDKETGEIIEHTPEEMFRRVAHEVAKAENDDQRWFWEEEFFNVMKDQLFMPNTPTLIGAGSKRCLSACSVIGRIPDSLEEIYQYAWYNAKLTKYGAGVGQDFSLIRPKGEIIKSSGGKSAGVVNWLRLFNTVAETTIQGDTARRAANMCSLRFNHPDIFDFITCKQNDGSLSNMNISVTITDEEMLRVINDKDINLEWNGKVYKTVKAREIFNAIIDGMWRNGEPGILWLDTINCSNPFNTGENFDESNPHYIITSNPCGEQVLESFEFCNLGSINLENLYDPATSDVDWQLFKDVICTAMRFLDDVITINEYVLPQFKEKVLAHRKIGLGVTGFANLLIKLGIRYDSEECLKFIDRLFGFKKKVEDEYNQQLGLEKGNFPAWKDSIYAKTNTPARCATVSTQAPTGSTSTILGTTAYGIEPLFSVGYKRRIVTGEILEVNSLFKEMLHQEIQDPQKEKEILNACIEAGTTQLDCVPEKLRNLFRCANDIDPMWHVKIQAQIQKYYDNAISKTINASENATKDELFDLLIYAWRHKCKGLTYYRNNSREKQTIQIGERNSKSTDTNSLNSTLVETTLNAKPRGYVEPAADVSRSIRYKLRTGCGTLYCNVSFDDEDNITETFIESANGGCQVFTKATSRLISLALRGGIPLEKVIDQLMSAGACPAYQYAKGKGEPVNKGKSCASAIANVLIEIQKSRPEPLTDSDRIAKDLEEAFRIGKQLTDKNRFTKEDSRKLLQEVRNKLAKDSSNLCPECGAPLRHESGCVSCECGYSKCD